MRLLSIASGSGGNSMLVQMDGINILIDAGISCRRISRALKEYSTSLSDLDAVLITHAHTDHISGLPALMNKLSCGIYMSCDTHIQTMLNGVTDIIPDVPFDICEKIRVTPVSAMHDCRGSLGFVLESSREKLGYLTDTGFIPGKALEIMAGSDCVVIESNHDCEMLEKGPYPFYLKKRIASDMGHLSNDACSEALISLAETGTRFFLLAHLSRQNNTPELARASAEEALFGFDAKTDVLPPETVKQYLINEDDLYKQISLEMLNEE